MRTKKYGTDSSAARVCSASAAMAAAKASALVSNVSADGSAGVFVMKYCHQQQMSKCVAGSCCYFCLNEQKSGEKERESD